MKRTIWASVTVGLAALMTFGCGDVFNSENTGPNGSNIPFSGGGNNGLSLKIYAVDTNGDLFSFFSDNPLAITAKVTPTGVLAGGKLVAIDFRPRTGVLYGIDGSGKLYWIDKNTGVCTNIPGGVAPAQVNADIDFNPQVDRIRQEADAQNVVVHPGTGAVTVQAALTINGQPANSAGVAYTNPIEAPDSTQLFVISPTTNKVYLQAVPSNGVLTEVGSLPFAIGSNVGFDIAPGNIGFAAVQSVNESFSTLLRVDPATGAASVETQIGGGVPVKSIAVEIQEPGVQKFVGIDASNNLVRFDSTDPTVLTSSTAITGLLNGDVIVGCDFIAGGTSASGLQVVAVPPAGGGAHVYTVNLATGVATERYPQAAATLILPNPTTAQFGVEVRPDGQMAIAWGVGTEANGVITRPIPDPPLTITAEPLTKLAVLNATNGNTIKPAADLAYSETDRLATNSRNVYVPALGITNSFLGGGANRVVGVDVSSDHSTNPRPFAEFTEIGVTANLIASIGEMALITTKTCELDITPGGQIYFCGNRLVINTPVAPATSDNVPDAFSTLYRVSPQTGGAITVTRIGGGPLKHFAIIPTLNADLLQAP